jgi:hypothetical protein
MLDTINEHWLISIGALGRVMQLVCLHATMQHVLAYSTGVMVPAHAVVTTPAVM